MSGKILFLFAAFFLVIRINAQESVLYSNDQYGGINTATASPTQPFLNPNPWDINLVSTAVFLQNDYGYISQMSWLALRNSEVKSANVKNNIRGDNTPNVFDFYNKDFTTFHFSSEVLGPSVSTHFAVKEKEFSVGLFTRLRAQTSLIEADNYLRYSNQDLLEPEVYFLEPLHLNFMNWAEVGLNFSTELFPYAENHWIIGTNLKYALGLDAVSVNSLSSMKLSRINTEDNGVSKKEISASDYQIAASYATSYDFDNDRYSFNPQGQGWGIDLGFTFLKKEENEEFYDFKASLNLLDFGFVNFSGENHFFAGKTIKLTDNPTFDNSDFNGPHDFLQDLSEEIYGSRSASFTGTDFRIGLSTTLHLNVSKRMGNQQYLNADLFQRITIFENSLKRNNIFNISYSVQKQVIGYGISASLYEYRHFQLGAYFRVGPLIFGSENIFPLFFKQEKLHSADLFVAVKVYPFWDNELKRHRREDCHCD